ncbi:MAG: hypothetical protein IIX43_05050 [Bacteroidales bacterium]|nr:hypothetical protein [Bacteroidales bacterium]
MIKYVRVKRTINVGDNPGEKFLARLWRNQDIDLDTMCQTISNSTTISYADVLATLKALEIEISKAVMNGSAVKLGFLGSFIPSISAKAMSTPDKVDHTTIRKVSCRFLPSVKFSQELKKSKFAEADLGVQGYISQ